MTERGRKVNKIEKVDVFLIPYIVKTKCEDATRKVDKLGFTIVKVTTDDGYEGVGLTYNEIGGEATKTLIEKSIAPKIIGKDVFCTEDIWNDLFQYLRGVGRKGLTFCAISAVDIALWDLKGKILNMPLNRLWGSTCKTEVPVYASGGWTSYSDDELLEEIQQFVNDGYTKVKFKVGSKGGIHDDLRRLRKVRDTFGAGLEIMLDANNCWDAATAIRFADRAKECDIAFLEEPVFADDIGGLRRFREASVVPLATGEHEYTKFGARELLERGATDIVQIDSCRTGGFTEMLKIAAMTQAWNVKFAPHAMEFINLHLLSTYPNALYAERLYLFNELWDNVFVDLPKIKDGYVEVPQGPGHGLKLNMDFVKSECIKDA